jgi:hypothetical protein
MIPVLRAALILFAFCLALDSTVAAKQPGEKQDRQEGRVFTGIHTKRGVGGRPNTARITDGKIFIDITEQEYRERGYIPAFDKMPMLIIQRLLRAFPYQMWRSSKCTVEASRARAMPPFMPKRFVKPPVASPVAYRRCPEFVRVRSAAAFRA